MKEGRKEGREGGREGGETIVRIYRIKNLFLVQKKKYIRNNIGK